MRKSGCRGITYERSETSGPAPSRRTDAHGSLEGQRYFFILFWPSPQSRDDQYVAGLQQKVARLVPHPFYTEYHMTEKCAQRCVKSLSSLL